MDVLVHFKFSSDYLYEHTVTEIQFLLNKNSENVTNIFGGEKLFVKFCSNEHVYPLASIGLCGAETPKTLVVYCLIIACYQHNDINIKLN